MQETRAKAETHYDFEEDDMAQQAEVTFEQGGSRWRRTASGYCFRDGRRVPRAKFDEARGRRYEELGARLARVADEASEAASAAREDDARAEVPAPAPEAAGGDGERPGGANVNRVVRDGVEWVRDFAAGKFYRDGEEVTRAEFERGVGIARRPRRRRSRDVAFEHEGTGVTLTARQCGFLQAASGCPCWAGGDGTLWTDVLLDEMGVNGMSFGAMVSTLREKGLLEVWAESREDGATGRSRKVKAMRLTDAGEQVLRAAGYRLPGR